MQRHYFIAVRLPEEVKYYLSEVARKVSDLYSFKRWVHREDYHITLAFLGPSEEQQWKACMEDITKEIAFMSPFQLHVSHVGVFGLSERPRIFWCGLSENEMLGTLQKKVAQACKQHQYRIDEKPFRPHITMARKYEGSVNFTQEDLRRCNLVLNEGITFMGNAVTLYESHVEKEQKYQALQTIYIGK